MWGFIKAVVRWFAALWVASVLFIGSVVLVLVWMATAGQVSPSSSVSQGAVLRFDLGVDLRDRPSDAQPIEAMMAALNGTTQPRLTLYDALRSIKAAAQDERVSGLYLCGQLSPSEYGGSFAALAELRRAIVSFRESGKPVWAYVTDDNAAELYLKSAAEKIYMHPFGTLDFKGLAMERTYWAEAFERYGVGVQVTRVGKYKSYADGWTCRAMSPADKEQNLKLIESVWSELRTGVASGRKLSPEAVDRIAVLSALIPAEEAVSLGLVDEVLYDDQIRPALAQGVAR